MTTSLKAKLAGWLPPVLIVLSTVAAFFPALRGDFVHWDDDVNIVQNFNYRGLGWKQLAWMFTNVDLGHYQPLGWVTLGLDYVLWGMDPHGYHLTNLILHALNGVLFYFVALRLLAAAFRHPLNPGEFSLRAAALFAALLFALHPLRVESVAWITERRGLLAGVFFFLSLLCYLRAVARAEAARSRWMGAALVAYGLSLVSKTSGVALPVVLLALDVYPLGRPGGGVRAWLEARNRRILSEKAPFLIIAIAAMAVAVIAEHQRGAMRGLDKYGPGLRVAQGLFAPAFYLWKMLVPAGLFPMYAKVADAVPAYWPFQPGAAAILSAGIAVTLALTAGLFLLRSRFPAGLANWFCYVALLGPVLGIVRFGDYLAADRYTYLACLGWPLLAAGGAISITRLDKESRPYKARLLCAAGVLVLAGLGALTWKQSRVWRDSETLFQHVLTVAPDSAAAHNNLGIILGSRGELDEAIRHYRLVLKTDPDDDNAHFNLGVTLSAEGKLDEAIRHYRRYVQLDHSHSNFRLAAYHSLGILLSRQGKLEEAAESYRRALEIEPNFEEGQNNLGLILSGLGRPKEAIGHFEKALELNPRFALAHANFADTLSGLGRLDEAIGHYRKALEIEPGMQGAKENLGVALARKARSP